MKRYYYAMATPRGNTTAYGGDMLCRFTNTKLRDAWIEEMNWTEELNQCAREAVTRDDARYWFPRAFAPNSYDYGCWNAPDCEGASYWSGSPTGGIYATV